MTPRTYRLSAAAARMGVSERTIRQWMQPTQPWQPYRPALEPIPGSLEALGYHLFAEPDLVNAERARRAGRPRRKAHIRTQPAKVPQPRGPRPKQPIAERFQRWVQVTDSCWIWTGVINNRGYGRFTVDGRLRLAHRVSYELAKGPIPEGLEVDHLCRVTRCVNPDHLEPVTRAENQRRGRLARAGACRSLIDMAG